MDTHDPTHLLWIDLETTDSDPHAGGQILELGAIITDWTPQLTEVGRASMLIRPAGNSQDFERLWQQMPDVVRQMHVTSGLWEEATASDDAWNIADADVAFAAWVNQQTGGVQVPLAGSGVGHLDLPYVRALMPHTATQLTYWPIDIGNFRRMLQLGGRLEHVDLVGDVEAKPHRALGDVELHVAEARRYLEVIGRLPQVAPVA